MKFLHLFHKQVEFENIEGYDDSMRNMLRNMVKVGA
jgi:hypothetical protein